MEQFLILKVEDALHTNSEGLLTELDAELFRHLVRVERVLGGVLLVEEIHLNNNRGQVMLLRIELIRSHINFLSITNIIILLRFSYCFLVRSDFISISISFGNQLINLKFPTAKPHLIEGECGPLSLGEREGDGASADVVVGLDGEDEVLAGPSPHVNVGTRLEWGGG